MIVILFIGCSEQPKTETIGFSSTVEDLYRRPRKLKIGELLSEDFALKELKVDSAYGQYVYWTVQRVEHLERVQQLFFRMRDSCFVGMRSCEIIFLGDSIENEPRPGCTGNYLPWRICVLQINPTLEPMIEVSFGEWNFPMKASKARSKVLLSYDGYLKQQ
ncbi:MAG: hypothetical protein LBG52_04365 [Candidatus Peribacteria bacterium]|nr:hypothetical protein [Candidatus Peribacteria bacterium]